MCSVDFLLLKSRTIPVNLEASLSHTHFLWLGNWVPHFQASSHLWLGELIRVWWPLKSFQILRCYQLAKIKMFSFLVSFSWLRYVVNHYHFIVWNQVLGMGSTAYFLQLLGLAKTNVMWLSLPFISSFWSLTSTMIKCNRYDIQTHKHFHVMEVVDKN